MNISAALQSVEQQIEGLGSGKLLGSKPSPALSRVTDTVVGSSLHDVHRMRPAGVPKSIPENGLLDSVSKASAAAKRSKTMYMIGIVIVCILIAGVGVAFYLLRKRNMDREKQEREEAAKRVSVVLDDDQDDENDLTPPLVSKPVPVSIPAPVPMPVPAVVPATPAPSPQNVEAVNMEAAVAKSLETKKRLEALKQQLDKGITNVVTNVTQTVAQTIVSEKAFQAHAAKQEHDEKVLLNQGTPDLAAAPLDKDANVIPDAAVLDEPVLAHPTEDVPVGGTIVDETIKTDALPDASA